MSDVATLPSPEEVLNDIEVLVSQSHWIQGEWENRCPWLDKDGNPVVDKAGCQIYKAGYCLGQLVGKMTGYEDIQQLDLNTPKRLPSLIEDEELSSDEKRMQLAQFVSSLIWSAIVLDETYIIGHFESIPGWNDHGTRTREDILRVVDRAKQLLRVNLVPLHIADRERLLFVPTPASELVS